MLVSIYQLIVAICVFGFVAFLEYLDWFGRSDVLKEKHPKLWALMGKRATRLVLLVVVVGFLAKDFHDTLAVGPPPEPVKIVPPSSPALTLIYMNPPTKERCWVHSYAVPGVPANALTTVVCNSAYKAPFSVVIEYDQKLAGTEPITFPIGGEFSQYQEALVDNKLSGIFTTPSIVPNEPFSVVVHGSLQKPPLATKITLRSRGIMREFSP
jgi:hypothetical protein